MPAIQGSIWVEGEQIRYCPSTTEVYAYQGDFVATVSSAVAGSIWMTTDGYLNYISETKAHRRILFTVISSNVGNSNSIGSLWIESYFLHSIDPQNRKLRYHIDASHGDHQDAASHTDTHTDTHSDVAHGDHTD
ncbi:MAG: hypothetical protein N3A54_01405, partial [Patescibacteria group bacterium]|nr:hypothetical protein [Patescibacteria group bacterium]